LFILRSKMNKIGVLKKVFFGGISPQSTYEPASSMQLLVAQADK
jgi:hypothetical protein